MGEKLDVTDRAALMFKNRSHVSAFWAGWRSVLKTGRPNNPYSQRRAAAFFNAYKLGRICGCEDVRRASIR